MCNHADTLLVCACVMLPSICDKLSPTYRLNEVAKGNALSPGHGCYVRHLAPTNLLQAGKYRLYHTGRVVCVSSWRAQLLLLLSNYCALPGEFLLCE